MKTIHHLNITLNTRTQDVHRPVDLYGSGDGILPVG